MTNIQQWKWLGRRERWWHLAGWAAMFVLAYVGMRLVYVPGSDWYIYFGAHDFSNYPPWMAVIMWPVSSLAIQNALTLTVLAYALWRYQARPIHYLLAFTALPVYWNLWLGQIDYIPLLGMLWLPWGLPLAAAKPQVAIWGALAWWLRRADRWKIAAVAAAGIVLSVVIYGWWPARVTLPTGYDTPFNLSAWRWGGLIGGALAVGLVLFVTLKARDIDASMALGALASPHVQGHSYLLLLPAFARLSGWPLIVAWIASWSGLLALLDQSARPLIALFPVIMWVLLTWFAHRPAEADFRVSQAAA